MDCRTKTNWEDSFKKNNWPSAKVLGLINDSYYLVRKNFSDSFKQDLVNLLDKSIVDYPNIAL
jgi:predicted DNA-binding protein (MmcQ/YjbR family)